MLDPPKSNEEMAGLNKYSCLVGIQYLHYKSEFEFHHQELLLTLWITKGLRQNRECAAFLLEDLWYELVRSVDETTGVFNVRNEP